ncbi:hypothetical protein Tco_0189838 [Tanacetum coccineum]
MRQDLADRMRMVYTRTMGRRIGDEMGLDVGLHTAKEMAEDGFGVWLYGDIPTLLERGRHLKRVTATDLFYLYSMDRGAANVLYLLAQYLFRHAKGRNSGARLSRGYFIGRLAHHFGLGSNDGLRGLSIVARELPLINMGELVKLNICMEIGDDWAWVAPRPKRQHDAAAGALKAAKDALAVDMGGQAVLAPVQAPQQPPPPTLGRTMTQRLGRLEEELMEASGQTYQAFDGTFRGSSPVAFQRRTRQRTGEAITSTTQQDQQQPDP